MYFNFKILNNFVREYFSKYTSLKYSSDEILDKLITYQEAWLKYPDIDKKYKKKESDYLVKKGEINLSWRTFKPKRITKEEIETEIANLKLAPVKNQIFIEELEKYSQNEEIEKPLGIIELLFTSMQQILELKDIKLILNDTIVF